MRISLQNNRWHFYITHDGRYTGFLFLVCGRYYAACGNDILGFFLGFASRDSPMSQRYSMYGAWAAGGQVETADAAAAELVQQGIRALRENPDGTKRAVSLVSKYATKISLMAAVVPDVLELPGPGCGGYVNGVLQYVVQRNSVF